MGAVINRINQILRGWTNYFRHAVCKHTLNNLKHFAEWRVIRWLLKRHRRRWKAFRRRFTTSTGRWLPIAADGVALFNPASVTVTRYRYRGQQILNPFIRPNRPNGTDRGEPGALRGARRVRRAARRNGPVATPEPRCGPTQPPHRPPGLSGAGRFQTPGDQIQALQVHQHLHPQLRTNGRDCHSLIPAITSVVIRDTVSFDTDAP
ncbi:hypothetical protein DMH04_36265 [Kibdelosporangium aridum]|uniref:Group II intron maturase-specific domain-containing protein n=1 Tax=Kibdelosporangium aridum TaxID=2030 RepID=A0A428YZI0_KIBAR|nr:hypothetical protein DMH04_36265 [Kibdelosporangium aridum]